MTAKSQESQHHVVIVGGGFGGLYAAKELRNAPVKITLIDKRNFHLFQPLLYQVATGGLSPGDIASPLRTILKKQANARVLQDEVLDVDPEAKEVILGNGKLAYDSLVLATGASNHYFGHDDWETQAPGLKTIEDAIEIRRQILTAFEAAEREPNDVKRASLLTFVIIGGGPTGVELAGAIAELASSTLVSEFSRVDPREARIVLLEQQPAVLPPYPEKSSANAQHALEKLGVNVETGATVEAIEDRCVRYHRSDGGQVAIEAHTILWAAGMRATPLTQIIQERTGVELDRGGRIMVDKRLHLPDDRDIFAIGDMAHSVGNDGRPLPGIAPVAMQQGRYVAQLIQARLVGKRTRRFHYHDKGSLAVIGRNSAVGVLGKLQISGFPAWLAWSGIHLWYLIEFDNRMLVLMQWAWNYFTHGRGARLITEPASVVHENRRVDSASEIEKATPITGSEGLAATQLKNSGISGLSWGAQPDLREVSEEPLP